MEFRAARTCLVFASAILLLSGSGCGSSNSGPPTAAELERMKALVRDAMRDGAVGLSTSLQYAPRKN